MLVRVHQSKGIVPATTATQQAATIRCGSWEADALSHSHWHTPHPIKPIQAHSH